MIRSVITNEVLECHGDISFRIQLIQLPKIV